MSGTYIYPYRTCPTKLHNGRMIREFGPSLYTVDGPNVSFYGFPYPTRMAIVRLSDASAWVWSPVALTQEIVAFLDTFGSVSHIVSPNKIHHLFLAQWHNQWPEARMYAPPGLAKRKPDLHFDAELGDTADSAWAHDIDQVIFRGSLAMEEVAFFHRASRTAIICDLIQRHSPSAATGWKGKLMQLDGLVGDHGSTPREWRASFLRRTKARAARDKLLQWAPERMLIAHGECAQSGAKQIIEEALSWM